MCAKILVMIAFCAILDYSVGSVIREKVQKREDYSTSFKILSAYRVRLQIEGLYPKTKTTDIAPFSAHNFDELEVLQLIPVTIKQLRHHKLSNEEQIALQKIFGSFWDLIEEDAHRKRSEPRNDLLSDLLSSREIRFGKQAIRGHLKNDIKGNTVQMVYNPDVSGTIKFSDDPSTEPSQRLLRMIAAICQQVYKERPAQRTRNKRSDSINLENVKVTIKVPRAKRSLYSAATAIKKPHGLTAEEQRRVDEANEAAIMAAVLAQIGHNELGHEGDEDADDEYDDDYYEDDDDDYLLEHTPSSEAVTDQVSTKGDKPAKRLSGSSNALEEEEERSPDYAYDESEADDDYYLRDFKPRIQPGDFENASVNELIMLAMRHHARKQSEQGKKSHRFRTV